MTALERKLNSEHILRTLGITILDELPPIEEAAALDVRNPQEIARRILILTYLNCIATNKELSEDVIIFLKQDSLWDAASEEEKKLFTKSKLTLQEEDMIRWRGEAIWLLLWTIYKVEQLDLPAHEINPRDIFSLLPEFMTSTADFVATATIRPAFELLDQADFIFRLTWAIQKVQPVNTFDLELNPGIAYERYFAISWVISLRKQWED